MKERKQNRGQRKFRVPQEPKKLTALRKLIAGVLFIASCFISAVVLVEFHDVTVAIVVAGILLLASAYFFLSELFQEKEEEWSEPLEEEEEEAFPRAKQEEFWKQMLERLESIDRTEKAMFAMTKRKEDDSNEEWDRLWEILSHHSEEQISGIKTIVKYNKENARQIAINERETMEQIMTELRTILKEEIMSELRTVLKEGFSEVGSKMNENTNAEGIRMNASLERIARAIEVMPAMAPPTVVRTETVAAPVEQHVMPMEEPKKVVVPEPEPEPVVEEIVIPESEPEPVVEEIVIPEPEPEPEPVVEEIVIPEPEPEPEPVVEEIVIPEPEPAVEEAAPASVEDLGAATGVDLSDPNASLSADDIAKLFAAANSAPAAESEPEPVVEEIVIPEPEPAVEEAAPASVEDLGAATGVDLSDPNASLSADDIAKLFAAANGN